MQAVGARAAGASCSEAAIAMGWWCSEVHLRAPALAFTLLLAQLTLRRRRGSGAL